MDWGHPNYREFLILQDVIYRMWCVDERNKSVNLQRWVMALMWWDQRQIIEETELELEEEFKRMVAKVMTKSRSEKRAVTQDEISEMLNSPEFQILGLLGAVFVAVIIAVILHNDVVIQPELLAPEAIFEYSESDLNWLEEHMYHSDQDDLTPKP